MNDAMNIAMNLDGGIHEIPLPTLAGRLWLCGKHFIGPDPERALTSVNANHVVCLVHERELRDRYDGYISWLQSTDRATWYPIFDLSSPPLAEILPLYVGVIPVPRLDDYFDVGIVPGEVQEVGGGREVGSDGGGGAAVFAIAYAELLELRDAARCHFF